MLKKPALNSHLLDTLEVFFNKQLDSKSPLQFPKSWHPARTINMSARYLLAFAAYSMLILMVSTFLLRTFLELLWLGYRPADIFSGFLPTSSELLWAAKTFLRDLGLLSVGLALLSVVFGGMVVFSWNRRAERLKEEKPQEKDSAEAVRADGVWPPPPSRSLQ